MTSALALSLAALGSATLAAPASASKQQVAMLQDDPQLYGNYAAALGRMRILGIDVVRLSVRWGLIAPAAGSHKRPRNFNAANPAAYPAKNWSVFDKIVRLASADGVALNFDVTGGAPLWATGPGAPKNKAFPSWEPSATEYGFFVRALGTRYSGHYRPAGASSPLPRVNFWSVWNEPDYGPSLAPQALPRHSGVEYSPLLYRGLVNAAWSALHGTGHGSDTFIWGELAPRAVGTQFGQFNGMLPLVFLRAMYCVDKNYRPLKGTAAILRGCPATPAASRSFVSQNPALFKASGVSDHPYMRWYPPNKEAHPNPQYTSLGTIGNLEKALNRLVRVYHQHKQFPVWNTEFGYITSPPKKRWSGDENPWVSPTTAAYYENWAEYLSWRDPRIASFDQYLLYDALPALKSNDYGEYASGLFAYGGQPKATYPAFVLPLYLPQTSAATGQTLEIWGAVRPAHFTLRDIVGDLETVNIEFEPTGSSTFTTIDSMPVTDPHGYFDTRVVLPQSGVVRLSWTYPPYDLSLLPGSTIYSRQQQVTIH